MSTHSSYARSILEMAAAAANLNIVYWLENTPMVVSQEAVERNIQPYSWSPHTNDGDSFRLMVQLGLHVDAAITRGFKGTPCEAVRWAICEQAAQLYLNRGQVA